MHPLNFKIPLMFLALFAAVGTIANAQIATLGSEGKTLLVGEVVMAPGSRRIADAKIMMSGQDKFLQGETIVMVTAGELMSVSPDEITFPAIEGLDVGEVTVALGPETVICNEDGTLSKDWIAKGQKAVAVVPVEGGPALSVRNALWMFEDPMMIPKPIDPSCANIDYPVLIEE